MPDIRIHRAHGLGLAQAREVAWAWAEQAELKFDMQCTVIEGETSDTVEFTRSGVSGELLVTPQEFHLHARLGLLLGAFSQTIRQAIESNLDALLGNAPAPVPRVTPRGRAAAKRAPLKKAPAKRVLAKKVPAKAARKK